MNRKTRRALSTIGLAQPPRGEQVVRQEYMNLCAQAGELQYKIGEMSLALKELNDKVRTLNKEYADILAEEVKSKETKDEAATSAPQSK